MLCLAAICQVNEFVFTHCDFFSVIFELFFQALCSSQVSIRKVCILNLNSHEIFSVEELLKLAPVFPLIDNLMFISFHSLFETTQTLFWAVFGLVDLDSFELEGIKIFTRFWGMLMFGTYSVINIVVLLNLLIAMMNHSYQLISVSSKNDLKTFFEKNHFKTENLNKTAKIDCGD